MNRKQLFDDWAAYYDQSIEEGDAFPFDGYDRVLDEVVRAADPRPGMTVLDLGIGTGKLAARLVSLGCDVSGVDFSAEMLAKARERLPHAALVQADLLGAWPPQLARRFDRIVSAYVLHEFDLVAKVALLQRLAAQHLAAGGHIVIGDIAFSTSEAREWAHRQWEDAWDEAEYYWAADEATAACEHAGLDVVYRQVSRCGGVFVIGAP